MRKVSVDGLTTAITVNLVLVLSLTLPSTHHGGVARAEPEAQEVDQANGRVLLTLDDHPVRVERAGNDLHQNQNKPQSQQAGGRPVTPHQPAAPLNNDVRQFLPRAALRTTASPRRKTRYPTADPRPKLGGKKDVAWHEDTHYYALRASVDDRFRIRHAPIPKAGSPWPLPQLYQTSETVFRVDSLNFEFNAIGMSCDVLEYGFRRIRRNMFLEDPAEGSGQAAHRGPSLRDSVRFWSREDEAEAALGDADESKGEPVAVLHSLNVTVLKECSRYPFLEMDESYDLDVKRVGASIIAREVWGALRGMETFSQMVYQDLTGRFLVNKTYIHDFPRFPHRGIMLDTSRHFLDKETIIANLEAIAQNKMNVFHWHIVDDQSFPFQSKVFPELTDKGAYNALTHIYTHANIAEIVEEARLRGIRVIPEFDTPGHTYSWGYGQDHLLTPCYDYRHQPDGFYGPINPILKSTYRFLKALFQEILTVYPDKYVHLGGDEVPFDCWYSNPFLLSFVKRNNLTDVRDLLNLYERKLLEIVTELGRTREGGSGYMVWQEVFDNGVKLNKNTIVQVWSGNAYDVDRVTSAGFRALFSSCWYLDYTNYGQDWDKYYRCDQVGPDLDNYNVRNQSLLIGGEACLWTEYADDDSILPRLWPRASAAAERLWSSRWVMDTDAAAPRIEEQRCRMLRRGLPVGVLSGPGHCQSYKSSRDPRPPSGIASWWSQDARTRMHSGNSYGNKVYTVDMSAMYAVPLVLVICICCLALLSVLQDSNRGAASRLVAVLTYPVHASSKKGVKGLIFFFMVFVLLWCIWTAPMWMNAWESPHMTSAHDSVKSAS